MAGLWQPANVYPHNRRRFHHLLYALRTLLWFISAIFVWNHADHQIIGMILGCLIVLVLLGILLWNHSKAMEVINQVMILADFIVLTLAIRLDGGLASQAFLLYGAEALFLTAYGALRYSVVGAGITLASYLIATGGEDTWIFWWRMVIMVIFIVFSGWLGREYRITQNFGQENRAKLEQLARLRLLQESIVAEPNIELVLGRLLNEAHNLNPKLAFAVVRTDERSRIKAISFSGIDHPTEVGLKDNFAVPETVSYPDDLGVLPSVVKDTFMQAGYRHFALMPLRYESSLYGAIMMACPHSEEMLRSQEFFLDNLAGVMATQLRFAEQQQVSAKRGQLLAILENTGRIVSQNLDMEQLLASLHRAVADVLEIDSFFVVFTLPTDPNHALVQYLWDDGEEYPPQLIPIDPQGLTGSVITTGKPRLVNGKLTPGQLTGSGKAPVSMLFVPLLHEGRVLGAMSAQSYRIEYDPDHMEFLSAVASQAAIAIRNAQMYQQTQELSLTDYLTGLGNSRRFNMVLQSAIEVATEGNQPLSLLLIDSDSLKSINDRFGHRAGDLHLQRVAQIIRENVREDDLPFRYAGDEFVIIVPRLQGADAAQVAERIRSAIETTGYIEWTDSVTGASTVSVGVASFHQGMTADELFQAADAAMYRAKQAGKNRVAYA